MKQLILSFLILFGMILEGTVSSELEFKNQLTGIGETDLLDGLGEGALSGIGANGLVDGLGESGLFA